MVRMPAALADAGLPEVRMLLQVHDELVFEAPEADADKARGVIEAVMAGAAEPAVTLSVPLGVEIGVGKSWGAAHRARPGARRTSPRWPRAAAPLDRKGDGEGKE